MIPPEPFESGFDALRQIREEKLAAVRRDMRVNRMTVNQWMDAERVIWEEFFAGLDLLVMRQWPMSRLF